MKCNKPKGGIDMIQREVENPMVRPITYRDPIKKFGKCKCGCGEEITSEYAYVRWEDMYFTDRTCLFRYLEKEHDFEEVG